MPDTASMHALTQNTYTVDVEMLYVLLSVLLVVSPLLLSHTSGTL